MTIRYALGLLAIGSMLTACSGGGGGGSSASVAIEDAMTSDTADSSQDLTNSANNAETTPDDGGSTGSALSDLTNLILENTSADCADHAGSYEASVLDIQRSLAFAGRVEITAEGDNCTLRSNNIPNHDFNDESANFASNAEEIDQDFTLTRSPNTAQTATAISQGSYDAILLNGVPLDLLSAGCYRPNDPMADADGNTPIGCNENSAWLLDPMSAYANFGTDNHNAHVQPGGLYHYHGDPRALFDDNPGPDGSPVIGWAADGYPVYGSYFLDPNSGAVRQAVSGYTLKAGTRPVSALDPGGEYDGRYIDDYEFTDAGDLDACNGMTVADQYGYYVTDSYPWVLACLRGEPHSSFTKF